VVNLQFKSLEQLWSTFWLCPRQIPVGTSCYGTVLVPTVVIPELVWSFWWWMPSCGGVTYRSGS